MKLVIVDDHPLVRKGLTSVLSLEADIEIVGEADDVEAAKKIIVQTNPDVVLIDLKLGSQSGLDIIKKVDRYKFKFVVLTSSADQVDFKKAEEIGVDGYVLKEALPEEIVYAIRLVYKGRKFYDPGIMELVIKDSNDDPISNLTPREKDVLIALGQGLSNSEIAKKLYITEYTVKKHVSQILSKLNLNDRTHAALYANSKGLVKYE